ncbi:hypothetical protein D3C87_1825940 [compost metagenome]
MVHDHRRQCTHRVPVNGLVKLGFSWDHFVEVHQRIISYGDKPPGDPVELLAVEPLVAQRLLIQFDKPFQKTDV